MSRILHSHRKDARKTTRSASAVRRGTRPRLEALEERVTPTVYTVTSATDLSPATGVRGSNSTQGDLRYCLIQAENDQQQDTIVFAPALANQTITPSADPAPDPYGASAFLIGGGSNTKITIDASAAPGLILNGAGSKRLFVVEPGASLTLENLTLQNGLAQGGSGGFGYGGGGAGLGGAVFDDSGGFTAEGCTFTNNSAIGGSGADNFHQDGSGGGGGMGAAASGQSAGAAGGGNGGGYGGGAGSAGARVYGFAGSFGGGGGGGGLGGAGGFGGGGGGGAGAAGAGGAGGFGGGGGAATNEFGTAALGGFGGGAARLGSVDAGGGGGGGMGGAIFSNQGSVILENDTLTQNTATGGNGLHPGAGLGGAVFARNGILIVESATLSQNTAAQGGTDLYVLSDSSNGGNNTSPGTGVAVVSLVDDILGQATNNGSDFLSGTNAGGNAPAIAASHVFITDNPSSGGLPASGVINPSSVIDPQLGVLGNYGGPTATLPLLPGSPAAAEGVPESGVLVSDQRGLPRSASAPDLGAFEQQPTDVTVTTLTGGASQTYGQVAVTATVTYDGNPLKEGSVSFLQGSNVVAVLPLNAQGQATYTSTTLSVGNYTFTARFSGVSVGGSTLYANTSAADPLTVVPAAASVVEGAQVNVTFDNQPVVANVTATGLNQLNLSQYLHLSYQVDSSESGDWMGTIDGTLYPSAIYPGNYDVYYTFSPPAGSNYAAVTTPTLVTDGFLGVTIRDAPVTITATPYNVPYDGNTHIASATAIGVGGQVLPASVFNYNATQHSQVGVYTDDLILFEALGYGIQGVSVTDVITQAAPQVVVHSYQTPYDAYPAGGNVTATGAQGVDLSSGLQLYYSSDGGKTLTTAAPVNVGTYEVYYTYTAPANSPYLSVTTPTDGGGIVKIDAVAANVSVTPYNVSYDGTSHTATATATGVGGVALPASDFSLSSTTHTNAGTYKDAWSFSDPNYIAQSGTVNDSITPARAQVVVHSYQSSYDGAPFGAFVTVTGVQGENLSGYVQLEYSSNGGTTFSSAAPVNVGTYEVYYTLTGDPNYVAVSTPTDGGGIVKINPVAATVTVTPYSVTYDGTSHSATATATGVGGVALPASDVNLTGTAHTSAGSYFDTWTFSDPNYLIQNGTVNDVIAQRSLTVTANPVSVAVGFTTLPPLTYQITSGSLVGSDALTGALASSPGQTAGAYPITQGTLTAGSNYALAFVPSVLFVTPSSAPLQSGQSVEVSSTAGSAVATTTPSAPGAPQLSATGNGFDGVLTVAQYQSQPEAAFNFNGSYFDINVASTDLGTASSVQVVVQNLAAGAPLTWISPSGQVQNVTDAVGHSISANSTGTATFTVTATTSPSISQLSGTEFFAGQYSPTITAVAGPTQVASASPLTATATLARGANEAGAITFTLYDPTGKIVDIETAKVNGNGTYSTPTGYVPTRAGTYEWVAAYASSNSLNASVSTSVGQAAEGVVGAGATVVGATLYLVGGNTNDTVLVNSLSLKGSTSLYVDGLLNGQLIITSYSQTFTNLVFYGYQGNDQLILGPGVNLPTTVVAGNGNDLITLGSGNDVVTLGNGNDLINLGAGNNSVTAGNGNDLVLAADGNNTIILGNGNDQVLAGNGNNVVVEGSGNDQVQAGNGDNLIVGGLGKHTIQVGDGSNILIDGSAQLTQSGDTFDQVLAEWVSQDSLSVRLASIKSRLKVTYNTTANNTIRAGKGLDWFWFVDPKDQVNNKPGDLVTNS